jgi:hypothetical protein
MPPGMTPVRMISATHLPAATGSIFSLSKAA